MVVSSTPHIHSRDSISGIMKDVLIALVPAAVMAVVLFRFNAFLIILVSVVTCVFAEWLYQKFTGQMITIGDFSAAVTGLLLAFNLPPTAPVWLPIVGSVFAIVLVKQLFGGLGQNFLNPALAARAFLLASYPNQMTNWKLPLWFGNVGSSATSLSLDAVSSATPLSVLKEGSFIPVANDYFNALIGNIGGCIGETCKIALICGALYLLVKKVINWRIPVAYICTFSVLIFVFGRNGLFTGLPLYESLTGGLILGAFFMATDYSSSPITPNGKILMGIGCGIIAFVIRVYGGYPEGVSYSILIMNLAVPLIDRFTKPRIFGEVAK